jgi:cell wall assembly regulator SMI1
LYSWRDGTDTEGIRKLGDISLFPGYYFLSLADAIANYRAFLPDRRWMPAWLPIFANGGGDFYVSDLSAAGIVRHFRIEESEHPVEFLTVSDMLRTIATGFERKLFFVDDEGYLEMDYTAFGSMAAELNPSIPWWAD